MKNNTLACDALNYTTGRDVCEIIGNLSSCGSLAGVLRDSKDVVGTIFLKGTEIFQTLIKGASGAFESLTSPLGLGKFLIDAFLGWLGLSDLKAEFGAVFKAIWEVLQGKSDLATALKTVVPLVLKFFGVSPENILGIVASELGVPASFLDILGTAFSKLSSEGFGGAFEYLRGEFVEYFQDLTQPFTDFFSDLSGNLGQLKTQLFDFVIEQVLRKVGEIIASSLSSGVMPAIQTGLDVMDGIGDACGSAATFIKKMGDAVKFAISDPAGAAATVKSTILGGLQSVAVSAIKFLAKWLGFSGIPAQILKTRGSLNTAIRSVVRNTAGKLKGKVIQIWDLILAKLGFTEGKPLLKPHYFGEGHKLWYDLEKNRMMMASETGDIVRLLSLVIERTPKNHTKKLKCLRDARVLANDSAKAAELVKSEKAKVTGNANSESTSSSPSSATAVSMTAFTDAKAAYDAKRIKLGDKLNECGIHRATIACIENPNEKPHVDSEKGTDDSGYAYERPTKLLAIITPESIRKANDYQEFKGYPEWWDSIPKVSMLRRGHILGSQLGGLGGTDWSNMTPLFVKANAPVMSACEANVRSAAQCGECILFEVHLDYTNSTHPMVPTSLRIVAEGDFGYKLDKTIKNEEAPPEVCQSSIDCTQLSFP